MIFTKKDHHRFAFIDEVKNFKTSNSYLLYISLRRSRIVLDMHRHNYIELRKAMGLFHNHVENSPEFWSNSSPSLRWNIQKKITTHIINYLNTASAIIDITRKTSRKYLAGDNHHSITKYIRSVFVDSTEFAFLRNLRNYIAHYSLLDVGVESTRNKETGRSNMIFLFKNRLLE